MRYFATTNQSREACTFKHFNDYLKKLKQFVGEGVWHAPPSGRYSAEADFYPLVCTFKRRNEETKYW